MSNVNPNSNTDRKADGNQTAERGKISRFVFLGIAVLFTVLVAVQIFLAGLAVFTDPSYWHSHVVFVRIFELFPILMLIFSFTGRLPKSLRWKSAAVLVLIFAQYFTANVSAAGAFHPVIAALLFWLSLQMSTQAKRCAFPAQRKEIKR